MIVEGRECVQGIDVSRWQGGINYNAFNLDFAFIKATGGDGGALYTDPKFFQNAAWPKPWGPYHFASMAHFDANREADHFCDVILASMWANLPVGMKMPPVLDWEPTGHVPGAENWIMAFLDRVEKRTGVRPVIYTGAYTDGQGWRIPALTKYALWLAAYTTHPPTCAPWGANWSVWQFTDSAHVAGVSGGVDSDYADAAWFKSVLGGNPSTTFPTPVPTPITPVPPLPKEIPAMNVLLVREKSDPAVYALGADYSAKHITKVGAFMTLTTQLKNTLMPPAPGAVTEDLVREDGTAVAKVWICADGDLTDFKS